MGDFKPYIGALNHGFIDKIKKFKISGDSSAHTLELNVKKEDVDKDRDLKFVVDHIIRIYNQI